MTTPTEIRMTVLFSGCMRCFFLLFMWIPPFRRPSRPSAEDSDALAGGSDARYGKILRAYHEVLMHHGVVDAHGAQFFEAVVFIVPDVAGIAAAESQVAGGVLVKERVVEEYAALSYRARVWHERALAEHGRALVHGDERAAGPPRSSPRGAP